MTMTSDGSTSTVASAEVRDEVVDRFGDGFAVGEL